MKKLFIILLTLALSLLFAQALGEPAAVKTGSGALNLRKSPSKDALVIFSIPNKATVEVLSPEAGGWYEISYKGMRGYVMAEFIALGEAGADVSVYTNTGAFAFLRESADDDAALLTVITYSMPITVQEYGVAWSRVTVEDSEGAQYTGYVRSGAISANRTEAAPEDASAVINLNAEGVLIAEQRLLEWPDESAFVSAVVPVDTQVVVLSAEGAWSHIRVDAFSGYVRSAAVKLTGKTVEADKDAIIGYEASYYTATVPGGALQAYTEPTNRLVTEPGTPWTLAEGAVLTVLQRTQMLSGRAWSLVSDGERTGWVLSEALQFSQNMEKYVYSAVVTPSDVGVAYARPGGARLYAAGTTLSNLLCVIPEGAEIAVTVGSGYVSATYNGYRGYIPREELIMGFVNAPGWTYTQGGGTLPEATPAPEDESNYLTREAARAAADKALAAEFPAFAGAEYEAACDRRQGGDGTVYYEFAYYKAGRYAYLCRVNAETGATLRVKDYTAFVPTYTDTPAPTQEPDKREGDAISASKARKIADQALTDQYPAFAGGEYTVQRERWNEKPGYDGPFYQFDYRVGEVYAFCCMVRADTGKVIYTANTWNPDLTELNYSTATPAPVYESTVLIGEDAARGIADGALAGKYPEFTGETFGNVSLRFAAEAADFEPPYYQFDYYVDGVPLYCAIIQGYTGRVLYTCGGLPGEGNG